VIDDRYDENDSRVWAENTIRWLGKAPDVVFTSELYGDAYAKFMGCQHVLVDQGRTTFPCSGTLVRSDPYKQWNNLSPPMRAWYAKRVVVLGAESTGTTTLAQALAERLQTVWVPEYGREYSLLKLKEGEDTWRSEEFLEIAHEQTERENTVARAANLILICDTNAFATTLWHRRYMDGDFDELTDFASNCRADLYLLTGDEIPFVQDGLRDGEEIRHEMHEWFIHALENQNVPYMLLRGDEQERLELGIKACEDVLRKNK
jgi:NadR type nicotinamide-nucleotide adenylyltransferase